MDKINNIWKLCTKTKQEVTQIATKLETTANDVTKVKASLKTVEGRLDVVEKETKTLADRVEAIEKEKKEFEQRLEEKLLKKLSMPRQLDHSQQITVSLPPKLNSPKLNPLKPPSRPSQGHFPLTKRKGTKQFSQSSKKGVANGVHEAFEELLRDQEARKNSFLVGELKRTPEDGVPQQPTALFSDVVSEFFDGVRFKLGRLSTARNGLKLGKVFVHPDDVHVMKLRCRDCWRAVKETGWWIGQENPTDIRKMEVNAFRFIMEAKNECDELRRYYLEAEEGFVRYARVPFLPVYLVPEDPQKWPELASILLQMVESIQSKNWVSRFRGVKKLDQGLLDKWMSVAGVLFESDADEEKDFDYDEGGGSGDIGSKLLYLGRARRPKFGEYGTSKAASFTATGAEDAGGADGDNANRPATRDAGQDAGRTDSGVSGAVTNNGVSQNNDAADGTEVETNDLERNPKKSGQPVEAMDDEADPVGREEDGDGFADAEDEHGEDDSGDV